MPSQLAPLEPPGVPLGLPDKLTQCFLLLEGVVLEGVVAVVPAVLPAVQLLHPEAETPGTPVAKKNMG